MLRLAAIDLDGTLLDGQNAISEGNAAALRALTKRGIVIAAATARPWQSALRVFEPHAIEVAGVVSGGADVRLPGGSMVRQAPLPEAFLEFLLAACEAGNWTATLTSPERMFRRQLPVPEWAAARRPFLEVVESFAGMTLPPILNALIEPRPGEPGFEELLGWQGRVDVFRAVSFDGSPLITVTAPGADKGHGLRALAGALGIGLADVAAFGDSEVDLPMFGVAGTAVAMANASDDVKAAASFVTAGAAEDGVALAIWRLLGEPGPTGESAR